MGQLGQSLFGTTAQSAKNQSINTWRLMQSTQGAVIPIVYGSQRVGVNWLWAGDYGVKGTGSDKGAALFGKGGSTAQYRIGAALALCSGSGLGVFTGQNIGVGRAWQSGSGNQLITTYGVAHQWVPFGGLDGQAPWGYLVTNHPESAFGFSGIAYVATSAWNLGSSPNPPQINFEVYGLGMITGLNIFAFGQANGDCQLDFAFIDLWLNTEIGCGAPGYYIGTSQPGWTNPWLPGYALSEWAAFMGAANMWFSPLLDRQQPMSKWTQEFLDMTMSDMILTCEQIYIRPYCTETLTGGIPNLLLGTMTFTPLLTPLHSFTDDDFIPAGDGQSPVTITRQLPQDRYNEVKVEYVNRNENYNVETIHAKLQSQIDQFLYRPAQVQRLHHITRPDVAMKATTMMLYKATQDINRYEFTVNAGFIWLDPMDVISITDTALGLNAHPVRILKIEEDDKLNLKFTCGDIWTCSPDNYATQPGTSRAGTNSAASVVTNVNTPVIFEPPPTLTLDTVQVYIAVSNPATNYGGCGVWVSYDNGNSYNRVGVCQFSNPQGPLTITLPAHSAGLDNTNTLGVNDGNSNGAALNTISSASAAAFQNLSYVDGELLSFTTATLTGPERYNLTGLYRGAYGTNPGAHGPGTKFAFLGSAGGVGTQGLFILQLTLANVGQTLKFKFTAFNQEGAQEQDVSTVPAYSYTVTGAGLPAIPYPFSFAGVPTSNATVTDVATQTTVLPIGLPTSSATASVAATGSTVFTIKHNGTTVGTITFAASATVGSFSFTGTVNLAIGDTLQVVAPASPDATLANITIIINGNA